MAKIPADYFKGGRRKAASSVAPRLPRPAIPPIAYLLSAGGGAICVVAAPDLAWTIIGLVGVGVGAYGTGRAEGYARPDQEARTRVRSLERALFQLALLGNDGSAAGTPGVGPAEAPLEPGPPSRVGVGPRRSGGIPGLRPVPDGSPGEREG